jgi:hypothetical protein
MGLGHSPSAVTSGMVLALDAGNTKSYPNTGTTWTDLSGNGNTGTLTNGPTFNSYEARTNVVLYSADFTSGWTSSNVGMSTVAGTAPDGTSTAVKLYPTASTIQTRIYRSPGASTCISVFAKAAEKSIVYFYDLAGVNVCYFNLSTGSIGTNSTGLTASIINCGSGWFRCSLSSSSAFSYFQIGVSDANGSTSSTASGTNGIFIWGAQAEIGSFATSYIPTTSSAVTRSAGPATLVFDGLDDYADCGYNSSIYNLTQNLTVEVWARWTGAVATSGNGQWIVTNVDSGATTNGGFQLGYIPGTGFHFGTYGNLIAANYSFVPVINTWYNLTGIKSSSSGYFIYLNGVSVATNVNLTAGGAASRNLRIAHRERSGAGGYFPGYVPVVKIYNTALTADQVLQNYNALRGRFGL